MATTEGNGSTGDRFNLGLEFAFKGVRETLGTSSAGQDYVSMCLGLHVQGVWGEVTPEREAENERNASDSALARGGTVVGMYPIPTFAQTGGRTGDNLMIVTLVVPFVIGFVGMVCTLVLLESEFDSDTFPEA